MSALDAPSESNSSLNNEDLSSADSEGFADESVALPMRNGNLWSARFNILCTMVGGGCLSLPFAFQKSGSIGCGIFMLLTTAVITEYIFRIIIKSIRKLSPVNDNETRMGTDTFETMTGAAFGTPGLVFGKFLVFCMCMFAAVGYCVLLRDMLLPLTKIVFQQINHERPSDFTPSMEDNILMLVAVLLVTPLCSLRTLSSLQHLGAASMCSILLLGGCIVLRSVECNTGVYEGNGSYGQPWSTLNFFPHSWKDALDVLPIFISCYVCHYNIPIVHNELKYPSPVRVSWWLRSSMIFATGIYLILGVAGSAYGHCTTTGKVHGNILLDFDMNDPLLMLARMCVALTISLALPMLVIPARDLLIRSSTSITPTYCRAKTHQPQQQQLTSVLDEEACLDEPLLAESDCPTEMTPETEAEILLNDDRSDISSHSSTLGTRAMLAIVIFWPSALIACCVQSIDIVWDLLGSSLSIVLSYLIPCGAYLILMGTEVGNKERYVAYAMIFVFTPLMFLSFFNAVYNTFFFA